MEATITSYFLAMRPGIMPSQSCLMISHWASILTHMALAKSTSKPCSVPSAATKL